MNISATPTTAALAGVFTGTVMPLLWARLSADGTLLMLAFLLVVAVPAHAFVVGWSRRQAATVGGVDEALLRRVAVWMLTAVAAAVVVHFLQR